MSFKIIDVLNQHIAKITLKMLVNDFKALAFTFIWIKIKSNLLLMSNLAALFFELQLALGALETHIYNLYLFIFLYKYYI